MLVSASAHVGIVLGSPVGIGLGAPVGIDLCSSWYRPLLLSESALAHLLVSAVAHLLVSASTLVAIVLSSPTCWHQADVNNGRAQLATEPRACAAAGESALQERAAAITSAMVLGTSKRMGRTARVFSERRGRKALENGGNNIVGGVRVEQQKVVRV